MTLVGGELFLQDLGKVKEARQPEWRMQVCPPERERGKCSQSLNADPLQTAFLSTRVSSTPSESVVHVLFQRQPALLYEITGVVAGNLNETIDLICVLT